MVDVVRENNREEIGESGIEKEVMEKGEIMESKATEERERERESQIESLRNLSELLLIF